MALQDAFKRPAQQQQQLQAVAQDGGRTLEQMERSLAKVLEESLIRQLASGVNNPPPHLRSCEFRAQRSVGDLDQSDPSGGNATVETGRLPSCR